MATSILNLAKPCVKCGALDRYKNGECKSCHKARQAIYRDTNPAKVKAYQVMRRVLKRKEIQAYTAAWYIANSAKVKQLAAARHAVNPEKRAKANAAWVQANFEKNKADKSALFAANPEARRIYWQNRKAKEAANGGILSRGLSEKLFALQKGKCACCNKSLGKNYHLDHIMPVALGGANTDDNIQLLTATCNMHKSKKHPINFMQSRGFLL